MIHNIIKDRPTRLFIILGGFFVANAIIAEMIGVKIFSLEDSLNIQKADFSLLNANHLSFSLSVGAMFGMTSGCGRNPVEAIPRGEKMFS